MELELKKLWSDLTLMSCSGNLEDDAKDGGLACEISKGSKDSTGVICVIFYIKNL